MFLFASGIEAVSYNPLGSIRRHSDRSALGEVGDLHIPRPSTGSKADPAGRRSSDDPVSGLDQSLITSYRTLCSVSSSL